MRKAKESRERLIRERGKESDEGTDSARGLERGPGDTERGFIRVDVTYANTNKKDVTI